MKISEQWLREWVSPSCSTAELAHQLTMAGLEVDSVNPVAGDFTGVVVGEVLSCEQHPNADRLSLCQVAVGEDEPASIICGAANVRQGLKVAVAKIGAVLPGDFKIKKAKLRGVASHGMLCSVSELGMADSSDGIMELPEDAPVGTDFRDYLALDDACIEIELTPNRGDCLGILGVAREVGALNQMPVKAWEVEAVEQQHDHMPTIVLDDSKACPQYCGRLINRIDANAITPLWMQEKLRRCGLRSIHPVVDVTNYVMLLTGQPMHAFNADAIQGAIHVRQAHEGEALTLLDGQAINCKAGTLVIADEQQALAMAGIMGGESSAVTTETHNIMLECAYFDPIAIAGKARSYGMQTDASYRFERGVDPSITEKAMDMATNLLLSIVGGKAGPMAAEVSDSDMPKPKHIAIRWDQVKRLLGIAVDVDVMVAGLTQLGCQVVAMTDTGATVHIPSHRFDLSIEADLIEEIARIVGYDALPMTVPSAMSTESSSEMDLLPLRLKHLFIDRGYSEAINYSFVDPKVHQQFFPDAKFPTLQNPIASDMAVMRRSLLPSLLANAKYNYQRQQGRIRLFEMGKCFLKTSDQVEEVERFAAITYGSIEPEQWRDSTAADFYHLKADLEAFLQLVGVDEVEFSDQNLPEYCHPGRSARIVLGGQSIGVIGEIHPKMRKSLGIKVPLVFLECDWQPLSNIALPCFEALAKFPHVRRDLALVMDAKESAATVIKTAQEAAGEGCIDAFIFDQYQGDSLAKNKKSLALALILQDFSRTLTEEDVAQTVDAVLNVLQKQHGAELRE